MDSFTGTSLRNVAPLFRGAWLKKQAKVSNPATNTSPNLHTTHNSPRTQSPAQPKLELLLLEKEAPVSDKLQGNLAPQKQQRKIEKIKMKLKLSQENQTKESKDVAKSTITLARRQPTLFKKMEDNQEDSQGVQKLQKQKLELKTVLKTVEVCRPVDKNFVFKHVTKLKTTTLQLDIQDRRQPVVQDNHCSYMSHNTAVQARYEKKPQEIATNPKLVNEDRSALLPSSALLLPTQTKLANEAL